MTSSVLSLTCCGTGDSLPMPPSFPLLCAGGSACYLGDSLQPPREVSISCLVYTCGLLELRDVERQGWALDLHPGDGIPSRSLSRLCPVCPHPSDTRGPAPAPVPTVPRACGFHPQQASSQAPLPPALVQADVPAHLVCFWALLAVPSGAFSGLPSPFPHPHFLSICTSLRFQTGSQLLPLLCTAAVPTWVPASVFCPFDDCHGLLAGPLVPESCPFHSTLLRSGEGVL